MSVHLISVKVRVVGLAIRVVQTQCFLSFQNTSLQMECQLKRFNSSSCEKCTGNLHEKVTDRETFGLQIQQNERASKQSFVETVF